MLLLVDVKVSMEVSRLVDVVVVVVSKVLVNVIDVVGGRVVVVVVVVDERVNFNNESLVIVVV